MKSVKSKRLDTIEKDVKNLMVDALPVDCVRVFGMVIIQQLVSVNLPTFGEMSEYVLNQ